MWLYHMVTYNPTAPCSECLDYDKWQTAKRTNADRIRAMGDVELAEMMAHGNCGYCKIHDYCFSQKGIDCDEAWLGWLKQEVTE